MTPPPSRDQLVRTIRLDHRRIGAILNRLDGRRDRQVSEKRRAGRYTYRIKGLVIHMRQPASPVATPYLVPTRDISEHGLAFLHGGYVHTGTKCLVQLITADGAWQTVYATVVRCRYLEGNIHEVGIRFNGRIQPADYSPEAIRCRVLLVDADERTARLATFHFQQLNAEVQHLEDARKAIDLAKLRQFDLILVSLPPSPTDGPALLREFRDGGFHGLLAATSTRAEPTLRHECLQAGCDRYLPQPYRREDLVRLVRSVSRDPLFSSYQSRPQMAELIQDFLRNLSAAADDLEEALAAADHDRLLKAAGRLQAEGSTHGYATIAQAATNVEDALRGGQALGEARTAIEQLIDLCLHARLAARDPNHAIPTPQLRP